MDFTKLIIALALILAHVIQILIPFIPGHFVPLTAGYYFGLWGLLVDWTGMMVGSLTAFYLARRYGEPLVLRFVDRDKYGRMVSFMKKKGTVGLAFLFIVPGMPKDALCFVAGISGIRFIDFLMMVIFIRFPADAILVLLGAGIGRMDWKISVLAGILGFLLYGLYFILSRIWMKKSGM